jgi:general stress protein YciG
MPNENDRNDVVRSGEQGSAAQPTQGGSTSRGESGSTSNSMPARGEAGMEDARDTMEGEGGSEPRGSTGTTTTPSQPRPKQRRGFAAMDPAKQKEIASKGGKASHAMGTGHEWDSESAREAGRKGGQASRGGRGKLPSGGEGTGGAPTSGT